MVDYKFYNANPLGKIEQDCVCRAISTCLEMPYQSIEEKLELIGELFECEELCVCCYQEIAQEFCNNRVIIRIDGHLTCSLYGIVYDIWDCTDEKADIFWLIN